MIGMKKRDHSCVMLALLLVILAGWVPARAQETGDTSNEPSRCQVSVEVVTCPFPGVSCLKVQAQNLSPSNSIMLSGKQATLGGGDDAKAVPALDPEAVCALVSSARKREKERAELAVSVATAGLGSLLAWEKLNQDSRDQNWLGKVAWQRKTIATLFGDRVLLPLEQSAGLLYFKTKAGSGNSLSLKQSAWPPAGTASTSTITTVIGAAPGSAPAP